MAFGDKYIFEIRAFCPCGYVETRVPFGDKFHIHKEVCPDCGRHKNAWELKTARWKDGRWQTPEENKREN